MTHVFLVQSEEGDWQGLYVDGKLAIEDHSLAPRDVLDALSVGYDSRSDWPGEDYGHLPRTTEEMLEQ